MSRRKFTKKLSKYADEAIMVVSTVKKIELQNVEVNQKLKTVFTVRAISFLKADFVLHGEEQI